MGCISHMNQLLWCKFTIVAVTGMHM